MTYFHNCKTCLSTRLCQKKQNIRHMIKGLGITSLKHNCDEYISLFNPGDPVFVTVYEWEKSNPHYGGECFEEIYPANFVKWSKQGLKALCFIAPGTPSVDEESIKFSPRKDGKGFVRITMKNITRNKQGNSFVPKQCGWCDAVLMQEKCSCEGSKNGGLPF